MFIVSTRTSNRQEPDRKEGLLGGFLKIIKIIFYVDIAFFYTKANILLRWSNILQRSYREKGLCHGCRSCWFRWQRALLHAAFEPLRYFIAGFSCLLLGCSVYEHTAWQTFFWTDNSLDLPLLDCSVTWLLLTLTDTEWTCWLQVTGSRHTSPETQTQIWNWLKQLPHHAHIVCCIHWTVHSWMLLLMSVMYQPLQNSCCHCCHFMTTSCAATYEISKKLSNQNSIDILMQHIFEGSVSSNITCKSFSDVLDGRALLQRLCFHLWYSV